MVIDGSDPKSIFFVQQHSKPYPSLRAAVCLPSLVKKPYIQLHSLVVILAFTAVLGHLIDLSAPVLVLWRTGIAAFLFLTILRPAIPEHTRPFKTKALLTGVILAIHWMTFFGSIKLSNISICLTGLATTSLFAAVIEALQERRAPRTSELLLGAIMIPSMVMIVGVASTHLLGLLCAILSAALAATFTVINKTLVRDEIPSRAIAKYEMIGASVTCALSILILQPQNQSLLPSVSDWPWLLLLAVVCTVLAYEWNIKLLRHFSAFETMLAVNFEPIYGMLMAAVFFGEHKQLHPLFMLGALLIILANFAKPSVQYFKKKRRPS